MVYRYNVSCSKTTSKNWTPTAIECYMNKCRCSNCNLYKIYFSDSDVKCKMKETVIELIREYGIPENLREEIF